MSLERCSLGADRNAVISPGEDSCSSGKIQLFQQMIQDVLWLCYGCTNCSCKYVTVTAATALL